MSLPEQIRTERLALIDVLDALDDAGWTTPSLCDGWTVQDVAAHLAWAPVFAPVDLTVGFVRAGFGINRFVAQSGRRWAGRGREAILAQLRANAAAGAKPVGVPAVAPLSDAIVHGYDIRRPLGLHRVVPSPAFAVAADWHAGLRFPATLVVGGDPRPRIRGLRLVADDVGWTHGEGPEVRATGETVLLVLTGRPVARDELSGPGAGQLWSRL